MVHSRAPTLAVVTGASSSIGYELARIRPRLSALTETR